MEQTFKNRPWPFVPECLSEIISEDVLEIIQTGISLKEKIPLLIVEFRDGEPKEISPIAPHRIEFCQEFRSFELLDGTKPGDVTCRICDYYRTASEFIGKKKHEVVPWKCHLGIIKVVAPILVANRVVAVFIGGQIVYGQEKWAIIENLKEWSNGECNLSEDCLSYLHKYVDFKKVKEEVSPQKINDLTTLLNEMKSHTPEDFKEREILMQKYTEVVNGLANSIYVDYKRAQEEEFFHKIAEIFDTSESTDIKGLKKTVSNVLDEICKFCGASSAILFANQKCGDNILDTFETARIKISDLHLNLNPVKIKEDISKPVIVEEPRKLGLRGEDAEKIKGFMLLSVVGDEDGYRVSLALNHPSPDAIISESQFFAALYQQIKADMANRLADINLAKQRDSLNEEYEEFREEAANVAHDFRIGLQPIRSSIGKWLLQCKDKTCSSGADERYKTISGAIIKLSDQVKKTLSPKTVSKEYISLKSVVLDCIESYRSVAKEKGIEIKVDDSISQLPYAFIEQENISLAMRNILDNAIKYSFSNTRIDVYSKDRDRSGRVSITFESYGIGVPPSDRERVFERYYRTETAKEVVELGSGIGLTEANEIIRRHSGDITLKGWKEVYPNVEKGYKTMVIITLPK